MFDFEPFTPSSWAAKRIIEFTAWYGSRLQAARSFPEVEFSWFSSHGVLDGDFTSSTQGPFRLLSRYEHIDLTLDQILQVADWIGAALIEAIPDLKVGYWPHLCESGLCNPRRFFNLIDSNWVITNPAHLLCEQIDGTWMCDDCKNILAEKGRREKSEREKLTATLRFAVLERDGFSCQACGRNVREDKIKLHVDHVLPIAKGGKTELANLQALCQECNAGKSDLIIDQMVNSVHVNGLM